MRRFYREVAVEASPGGHRVLLDGRPVRTPGRALLEVPGAALAEAVAAEWRAQQETIEPGAMPLTRLVCTAIDRVAGREQAVANEIARYAETDLVCYRAEGPADLRRRQDAAWQPLVDWAAARYQAPLVVAEGVMPVAQDEGPLRRLATAVAAHDALALTALHGLTAASGSLVLALAVAEGVLDDAAAWRASRVDAAFQAELWGEDAEAARGAALAQADFAAAARLLRLLSA